jgi:S-formylglutathione hydrolase FrmB
MTMSLPHSHRPHWSQIAIDGHACELFAPSPAVAGRAIIYLHDLRGGLLQESAGLCAAIEAAGLPVIAPRGGRGWWLDKVITSFDPVISPERFIVERVRGEIERRFGAKPPGIALVGIGMGGQGALRIAYRHPAVFPIAAAIAPSIDFHQGMREAGNRDDGELYDMLWDLYGDVEPARQDTAILHVHPLNWPRHQWFASDPADMHWHDGAVRLHSKLAALGIPHEWVLESRGPPEDFIDRVASEAIAYVIAALDKESRRVA